MSPPPDPSELFARLARRVGMEGYLAGSRERLAVTADLLRDQLGGRPPAHVIDLGAFPGFLSLYAREALGAARVTAVTLTSSPECDAAFAAAGVEQLPGDVEAGPLPRPAGDADVVLFCEVLEHLLYPHAAAAEIARLLRPGGLLIASTPDLACLRNRVRLLRGLPILDPLPPGSAADGAGTYRPHVRTYLVGEAERLFAAHGLRRVGLRRAGPGDDRPGLWPGLKARLRRLVTAAVPSLKDTWIMALRRDPASPGSPGAAGPADG